MILRLDINPIRVYFYAIVLIEYVLSMYCVLRFKHIHEVSYRLMYQNAMICTMMIISSTTYNILFNSKRYTFALFTYIMSLFAWVWKFYWYIKNIDILFVCPNINAGLLISRSIIEAHIIVMVMIFIYHEGLIKQLLKMIF